MRAGNENETELLEVHVKILSQRDLRAAWLALTLLGDDEKDAQTASSLRRVRNALWDITNLYGIDAIGSDAIIGDHEYLPRKTKVTESDHA